MSAFVQIQSGLAALDRIQEIARLDPERSDEAEILTAGPSTGLTRRRQEWLSRSLGLVAVPLAFT